MRRKRHHSRSKIIEKFDPWDQITKDHVQSRIFHPWTDQLLFVPKCEIDPFRLSKVSMITMSRMRETAFFFDLKCSYDELWMQNLIHRPLEYCIGTKKYKVITVQTDDCTWVFFESLWRSKKLTWEIICKLILDAISLNEPCCNRYNIKYCSTNGFTTVIPCLLAPSQVGFHPSLLLS